jgi:hypothetical protein
MDGPESAALTTDSGFFELTSPGTITSVFIMIIYLLESNKSMKEKYDLEELPERAYWLTECFNCFTVAGKNPHSSTSLISFCNTEIHSNWAKYSIFFQYEGMVLRRRVTRQVTRGLHDASDLTFKCLNVRNATCYRSETSLFHVTVSNFNQKSSCSTFKPNPPYKLEKNEIDTLMGDGKL